MKFAPGYMYPSDPELNRLAAAAACLSPAECLSPADSELDPDPLFSLLLFFSDDLDDDLSLSDDDLSLSDDDLSLSTDELSFCFLLSPSEAGNPGINPGPNPGRLNPENPRRGFERFMFANPPKGNPKGLIGLFEFDAVEVVDDDGDGDEDEDVFATDAAA